jgi:crotonobetainyl-CoA:carnitine CoA-transferase CaiB-like acyl-CoA transferase
VGRGGDLGSHQGGDGTQRHLVPGWSGDGNASNPQTRAYTTSDGKAVAISAVEPRYWSNFCRAIGRDDLGSCIDRNAADTDFGATFEGLCEAVTSNISLRTAQDWEERLADADVPFAVVTSKLDALTGPQARARGVVMEVDGPDGRVYRTVGGAFLLDGERGAAHQRLPVVGQHTIEVLKANGYDTDQLVELIDLGVVAVAPGSGS